MLGVISYGALKSVTIGGTEQRDLSVTAYNCLRIYIDLNTSFHSKNLFLVSNLGLGASPLCSWLPRLERGAPPPTGQSSFMESPDVACVSPTRGTQQGWGEGLNDCMNGWVNECVK